MFRFSDLDRAAIAPFFSERKGWPWKDFPVFALLYHRGVQPALICSALALVTFILGFRWPAARRWRKISGYYLLVMVIGPGLLVNAVLKEHWGRPRPRETTDFGGRQQFEMVWEYDAASPGKSFPSGHASMGFCLFALYFIGRALRRRWAWWAVLAAVVLGVLLGLARMAQGGHFASDVLWSAGICYFVALILFRAMRLGERPFYEGGGVTRAAWLSIGGAFFAAGLLAVAIPYNEEKLIAGDPALLEGAVGCDLGIELKWADLWIREGDGFRFGSHVEGFGSLGNRQEDVFDESLVSGRYRVRYGQRRKGFAATIEQPAELLVPNRSPGKVKVEVGEGSVNVELFSGVWDWTIEVEDGDLVLWLPADLGVKIVRESIGGDVINGIQELGWSEEKGRWKRGEDPQVRVKVNVGGNLEIKALLK